LLQARTALGGDFANVAASLCGAWAESQPVMAEQWVADHSAEWQPYERDEANAAIVNAIARERPWEAVGKLPIIPDPERRELAMREIFAGWADSDPAGAAAALPPHRSGHDADLATEIALTWSSYDPAAAAEWVKHTAAIPDELRDSVLKRVDDAQGGSEASPPP
jgi:hypothetical protein